jgi:hypothetical protein
VLQCVARAEVFGSGLKPGIVNTITVVSPGNTASNQLLLRGSNRSPFLHLEIALDYTVAFLPGDSTEEPYQARVTTYLYAINDLSGRELFAYHWHPQGVSHVKTPHLHFNGADPMRLPVRPESPQVTDLSLSRSHFPTRPIELSELIHFLIRDLAVEPRRPDWERVLEER